MAFTEKQKKEYHKKRKETEDALKREIKEIAKNYKESPEELADFFSFSARFYTYSPRNVMLIRNQNPGAVLCKSFASWNEAGVRIKKGERGMKIFVPAPVTYIQIGEDEYVQFSGATKEQQQAYKEGRLSGRQKMTYKLGSVFDIAQTDFPKEDYPMLLSVGTSEASYHDVYEKLKSFAEEELDCPVKEDNMHSIGLKGSYYPGFHSIKINELLEDTEKVSTLSHEMGHALLHSGKPSYSKARKEFEADCVSIMIDSHLGLEVPGSRKSHLATHFRALEKELENEGKDMDIDEIFSDVYEIYKENIQKIDEYMESKLPAAEAANTEITAGEMAPEKEQVILSGRRKTAETASGMEI